MSSNERLRAVDFEVFGRVQGVFFRKVRFPICEYCSCIYTEKEAKKLGLKGWCLNTPNDTVKGVLEGVPSKLEEMKKWLQKTGSPQSRIDTAIFSNEHDISEYSFDSFSIKH
ncbi:acylphosphatase-2 isoform X1 [Euwallacea similis]|uniref:acylphosphatase-2 isoform X1 n=1 Tax=Euwallacea similis TaxID=1736056 RepID=UPI00344C4619